MCMPGMWLRDGPDEFTTETISAEHTDLPLRVPGVLCRTRGKRWALGAGNLRAFAMAGASDEFCT